MDAKIVQLPETELDQPVLFDDVDAGSELLSIETDAASGRATGTTLEKRRELCEEICRRLATGVSQRGVCRIYGVGPNTVRRLVERMELAGKMDAVKRRVSRKLGAVAELGADELLERLHTGSIQSNVLPIAVGVALDKKEQLDRDVTEAAETALSLDADALNDWVERLPRVAPDSPSDAGCTNAA